MVVLGGGAVSYERGTPVGFGEVQGLGIKACGMGIGSQGVWG